MRELIEIGMRREKAGKAETGRSPSLLTFGLHIPPYGQLNSIFLLVLLDGVFLTRQNLKSSLPCLGLIL